MAKQDPHADEPTREVDRQLNQLLENAKEQKKLWTAEVDRLEAELLASMDGAYAATVDGKKVWTHRPEDRYAERALMSQHPDLTQHYIETTVVQRLNMARFAAAHPDIASQFQVRSLRAYSGPSRSTPPSGDPGAGQ